METLNFGTVIVYFSAVSMLCILSHKGIVVSGVGN